MIVVCVLLGPVVAVADVYLHFPPGSNNRYNEYTLHGINKQRLFNSRNSEKGGYNVPVKESKSVLDDSGDIYYYRFFQSDEGKSNLNILWSIIGPTDRALIRDSAVIIQYMCKDHIIPDNEDSYLRKYAGSAYYDRKAAASGSEASVNTGTLKEVHESPSYFERCFRRERTLGMYTADQKLSVGSHGYSSSVYTRQNPNGIAYGYECPEERDYYPYWHSSPWIDAAIFLRNVSLCSKYIRESFNTKPRYECFNDTHANLRWSSRLTCLKNNAKWVEVQSYAEKASQYTNQKDCPFVWGRAFDAHNVSHKECLIPLDSPVCGLYRDAAFKWTLPRFPSMHTKRCIIRIRYNISSGDYDPTAVNSSYNAITGKFSSPVTRDPEIEMNSGGEKLKLMIDPGKMGITFQDRSHTFELIPRRGLIPAKANIININVEGRRGSHVQIFPSRTYGFVPPYVKISTLDLIHIQWAGSNTHFTGEMNRHHSRDNEEIKIDGTDRHNLVQIEDITSNYPMPFEHTTFWKSIKVIWPPFMVNASAYDLALWFASSGYYRNRSEFYLRQKLGPDLNEAAPSFVGAVFQVFQPSTFHFLCTRNNRFSVIEQKLTIEVLAHNRFVA